MSEDSLDDPLCDLIIEWLEERGADSVWLCTGPDRNPEDWE